MTGCVIPVYFESGGACNARYFPREMPCYAVLDTSEGGKKFKFYTSEQRRDAFISKLRNKYGSCTKADNLAFYLKLADVDCDDALEECELQRLEKILKLE